MQPNEPSDQVVYTITGQLCADADAPAEWLLALVDRDRISDDLIGYGIAGEDGAFRLSFTREAFNQEWYEHEESPDLEAVVSVNTPTGLSVIAIIPLPSPTPQNPSVDAGSITVHSSPSRPRQRPLPGYTKKARRLRLEPALVQRALTEIAPMVEHLTGWDQLAAGITVEIVDDIHQAHHAIATALGLGASSRLQGVLARSQGIVACYDPFSRTISLDRRRMERQNYDGLKVIIGHELVHVGQFREHPALLEEYRDLFIAIHEEQQAAPSMSTLIQELSADHDAATIWTPSPATQRMASLNQNIEGYAFHVEVDFLRVALNCAWPMPHHTTADQLYAAVVDGLHSALGTLRGIPPHALQEDASGPLQELLIAQVGADLPVYQLGRARYRRHQREPDRPFPFIAQLHHATTRAADSATDPG